MPVPSGRRVRGLPSGAVRLAPVVLLALGVGLVPACGDDGDAGPTVATDEWATTVCTAVGEAVGGLEEALGVIDQLSADIAADDPLGPEQAAILREAFAALPVYVDDYLAVVEATPAPDTADGVAFRDELVADLDASGRIFARAALAAEAVDADTTVADFFTRAQGFARFPEAFAAADLAFDDPPPGVAEAMAAESVCDTTQGRITSVLG